jgi:hypothetical protein
MVPGSAADDLAAYPSMAGYPAVVVVTAPHQVPTVSPVPSDRRVSLLARGRPPQGAARRAGLDEVTSAPGVSSAQIDSQSRSSDARTCSCWFLVCVSGSSGSSPWPSIIIGPPPWSGSRPSDRPRFAGAGTCAPGREDGPSAGPPQPTAPPAGRPTPARVVPITASPARRTVLAAGVMSLPSCRCRGCWCRRVCLWLALLGRAALAVRVCSSSPGLCQSWSIAQTPASTPWADWSCRGSRPSMMSTQTLTCSVVQLERGQDAVAHGRRVMVPPWCARSYSGLAGPV